MSVQRTRCLVTGATGYVGGRLVPRLLDDGFTVRALARRPDKLAGVPWRDSIEVARGDLTDTASLSDAFTDVDVVYYLVHSMGTSSDFAAEERRAAQNVAAAARRAGVRRIVYLSGLHPDDAELSTHLASRTTVGEILMASGIETIVLQAGVVVGSGSASFEMIRHLTDRLPVMTTPRWVHNKIQPIAIGDVLHYLSAAATATVPTSRAWDVGGPDVLEYGDMMQIYAEVAGLARRRMLVLPVLTPRIAALWVGLVTPIPSGLARPLVESLHCDAVMDNHDIDTIIEPPAGGPTPYREAVALALDCITRGEVETTWDGGTAAQLPGDPEWAGAVVYVDHRSQPTPATREQLWEAVERAAPPHWQVETRDPGHLLRLRDEDSRLGSRWLEMRVTSQGSGSRYEQRWIFFPRGLVGRLSWFVQRPLLSSRLGARVRQVIDAAE
ncbi:NAD(P)H-binding protein [Mycobacterium sp. CVI_P3]|uniref:NAD(P)H-binding protein n=1 Tax=Mycobacterium pinniadriaticum TaxID=2994102 RepID=A0ABT3S747_9MYCO|nr:NAD(P)H-binding protein [Mycobacterium pinniadriaticum]MCX2928812.1 NAD(P)H-binding protein [Mycobacterium pinniadriaticum]MCX2935321.1 NAD(P)H-binding protein [Mycobacterium pinniadriaticum]